MGIMIFAGVPPFVMNAVGTCLDGEFLLLAVTAGCRLQLTLGGFGCDEVDEVVLFVVVLESAEVSELLFFLVAEWEAMVLA